MNYSCKMFIFEISCELAKDAGQKSECSGHTYRYQYEVFMSCKKSRMCIRVSSRNYHIITTVVIFCIVIISHLVEIVQWLAFGRSKIMGLVIKAIKVARQIRCLVLSILWNIDGHRCRCLLLSSFGVPEILAPS